jgi:chemotaxis protein histidine kinase CheA
MSSLDPILPADSEDSLAPASQQTTSFANYWQGSPEVLHQLEEALRQELNEEIPGGAWVNPLEGLHDDPSAEEAYLKIFIDDTLLTLEDLTRLLLRLEGGGTHEELEKLVAIFHRIKGSAAMVGLKRAAKLAHSAEDGLQQLLDSGGILSSDLTDAVLKSSDALGEYVQNLRTGIGLPDALQEAAQELHLAGQSEAGPRTAAGPPASAVEMQSASAAPENEGQRLGVGDGRPHAGETLRVEIGHLDRLMGLAGQLTIQKARFHSIMERFNHDPSDRFRDLFEAVDQLDRISDEIRRGVMDVRMVPIGPLLNRYHRVVRDLTRNSGKIARLEILGEKTELDKRMIDELSDPLLQIVRNALDHGIEHPEVRLAAGKTREGRLSIQAFHRGNSILIQVSDDGAGLDLARLRAKGVEKGLVTPAEAESMTPEQVQDLIWKAGMSTAQEITEVSGRGVGMDIVRSKIEGLHGTVEIDSLPGQGTTFSIRLPLTLAILPCLMIVVDGETFAIPMELVKEIIALDRDSLLHTQGGSMVRIRQRVLAAMRLDEVFSWQSNGPRTPSLLGRRVVLLPAPAACPASEPITFVIVGERGQDVGLAVDRVLGQEDVVIKSISENYREVPGVAGATILGDGRVALILDIPALLGRSFSQGQLVSSAGR